MPYKATHDLVVRTGSYTDREGSEKGRFENVGTVMKDEDNNVMLLFKRTFNPAGVPNPEHRDSCIVSMFKKDRKEAPPEPKVAPVAPHEGRQQDAMDKSENIYDDDLPF
ncbi:unnamed protein product [marine sediment metagenome]|uniref:Uncharacterized protein n=1 Tax=marine sediment metagenome TaxID=412755 RepID=X0RWB2_9ZZZZ